MKFEHSFEPINGKKSKWDEHSKNNINKWAHFRAGGLLPGNPSQMLFSANPGLDGYDLNVHLIIHL